MPRSTGKLAEICQESQLRSVQFLGLVLANQTGTHMVPVSELVLNGSCGRVLWLLSFAIFNTKQRCKSVVLCTANCFVLPQENCRLYVIPDRFA